MEKERLRSYFDESMIYDGIMNPTGHNIAPKFLNTGSIKGVSVSNCFETKVDYTDDVEVVNEDCVMIRGSFTYGLVKEYTEPCQSNYEMYDNGQFMSMVRMEDAANVNITTNMVVNRRSVGGNFDGHTNHDGLLPSMNHTSCRGSVIYHEYFRILENGMQMIHYSDADYPNDDIFFELYSIPDGYTVSNGLEGLGEPMVFNIRTFNKQHPSYAEIESLVKPKEKIKTLNIQEQKQLQQEDRKGYYFN